MTPQKRGIYVFLILLLAGSVSAMHTATVTTDYQLIYETTSTNVTINVANDFFSIRSINNVTIFPTGFRTLSAISPSEWTLTVGDFFNYFTTTSAISSWGSQNFGIEIAANKLDNDETYEWAITTVDTVGDSTTNTLQFLVLNDDTPPELLNIIPEDKSFLKEGSAQLFSIDAVDNETGVESVSLLYGLCNNITNSASLIQNGNTYSDEISFPYGDSTVVCYEFSATNNGGETATYPGQLTIDGVPPSVELVEPEEDALLGNNSEFSFNATDNLSPELNCLLVVDGIEEASTTANNNEITTIPASEAPEGTHTWSVTCYDLAGWEATSDERSFTLDKTPPNITTSLPNRAIIKAGTPINVEVIDNHGVDEIWYEYLNETTYNVSESFTIDTTNGTDGENFVTIHATDLVGNSRVLDYIFIIDKAPPSIELILPEDSATVDVHTLFIFNATDNYDPVLDCILQIGNESIDVTANNSLMTEVSRITDVGEYNWYVECIDDADNSDASETRALKVIDVTGPDIIIAEIGSLPRGSTVEISAEVTDYSGVDSVYATITGPDGNEETLALEKDGDIYTADYETSLNSLLGTYQLTIYANDTAGNEAHEFQTFNLINSYIITLSVSSPVYTDDDVTASGTVARDDGQEIQTTVTIITPSGTYDIETSASGEFSKKFNAPLSKGTYKVTALLEVDGFVFSETENFEVKKKSSSSGGGRSRGHSGIIYREEETPNSGIIEPEEPEEETPNSGVVESQNLSVVEEEPEVPIGKASGIFTLENLKSTRLWLILLAIALIISTLKISSKIKSRKRRGPKNLGLEDYINRIRRS